MSATQEHQPRPRRVLNLKAVAICVVVVGVVSTGLRHMHGRQVVKTTAHLKQQADRAVQDGPPNQAIQAIERYLTFSHGDRAARLQLAELLEDHATDEDMLRMAYAMNEGLLLDDRNNDRLRLRQAKLAVRLKLFSDADSHLTMLRSTLKNEPQVWYLSGVVEEHAARVEQAIAYYRSAVDTGSSEADCFARLAGMLTEQGASPAEIEPLFDNLIADHESADAHRVKARWLLAQNRDQEAITELWTGLDLEPTDIQLNGILVSMSRRNSISSADTQQETDDRLFKHLRTVVQDQPSEVRLRLFYAHALWNAGQRDQAVETLKTGITRNPQAFELQEVLIDYLVGLGKTQQAVAAFKRLPRSVVDHARWHFLEGRVHMASEQWQKAAISFERASGFSGADERVRLRSGLCLAACRRELGERKGAMETYRTMIQASPNSRDSRLGMAAAWLEAGRLDLAIAEYRQLQDVDGVPELLASLLIRESLRQAPTLRNWREVETLLREDDPIITDEIQRLLLRADLLFAQGYPGRALRSLDIGTLQHPNDTLIQSARRRVLTDSQGTLLARMNSTLQKDPDSLEAWVAILRLHSHIDGPEGAVAWWQQSVGNAATNADRQHTLVALQAAELAAADLERTAESTTSTALLTMAELAWQDLTATAPEMQPRAAGFLARHRDNDTVLTFLRKADGSIDSGILARSWLAALENSDHKEELRDAVEQALRDLIVAQPAKIQLRQTYVEYLLQFADYESALAIGRQILQQEPHNAAALSRCAWILTMSNGDHTEALALSESASRYAPVNSEVRTVRALVLAHSESPETALPVFESIPSEARSAESFVYEALALLRTGNHNDAVRAADSAKHRSAPKRWRPADQQLLKDILQQVVPAEVAHN